MNRRETLKTFGVLSLGAGTLFQSCRTEENQPVTDSPVDEGMDQFERDRLERINREPAFFNEHERLTLIVLADIIIPRDEVSGSASEAKVIDFIEFIVKDIPEHQLPMRGGLKWLDLQCLNRYGESFRECSANQQLEIVEEIAYPLQAKPEMHPGVVFFNRMRDLTATGFYTSEMGIKDIGYVGNVPNRWQGVPADVLAQYNLDEE